MAATAKAETFCTAGVIRKTMIAVHRKITNCSPYLLTILPSYATVLWIGKLWDWVVRRRRQAGVE